MNQNKDRIALFTTLILVSAFLAPVASCIETEINEGNQTAESSHTALISEQRGDRNRTLNETDAYGFHDRIYPWSDLSLDDKNDGSSEENSLYARSAAAGPWTQMNASPGWSTRGESSAVVMPDGSIVLMGGGREYSGIMNDVWKSMDNGATWTRLVEHAPWAARSHHAAVVMPDDNSIILMGGWNGGTGTYMNDVWRSTDYGATWTRMNASAGWSPRFGLTSVVLSDNSIILMGGTGSSGRSQDVWRSTNYGATWTRINASAGWSARYVHNSVVMPNDSIILMGGYATGSQFKNDVWRSTDGGATWTLINASAGWTARFSPVSVVMPDNSIMLMSGYDGQFRNDVWQSMNSGTTWEQVTTAANWSVRYAPAGVVMPDGSIVLMSGVTSPWPSYANDVWRYVPAPVADFTATPITGTIPLTVHFTDTSSGSPNSWNWSFGDGEYSIEQDPVHTYSTYGTHSVNLTVSNSGGSNFLEKPAYIMGTGGTYSVFVEGISDYNGTAGNLMDAAPLANNFYSEITEASIADTIWQEYAEHYNESAGSKYWSVSESSAIKADYADFALFAGHGNKTMIAFGTPNSQQQLTAEDMEFGTNKAKWITLSACFVLNESTNSSLKPVFKGLHILNGYDTEGLVYENQGTQFAQRMKGEGYPIHKIRDAWMNTLKQTINIPTEAAYNGAWMWAEPCKDDYLPGYGTFCSAPTTFDGEYDIHYDRFNCV